MVHAQPLQELLS